MFTYIYLYMYKSSIGDVCKSWQWLVRVGEQDTGNVEIKLLEHFTLQTHLFLLKVSLFTISLLH